MSENADLQARIDQAKPERLATYGLTPDHVQQDLVVDQDKTISAADPSIHPVVVQDFMHLKSLIGVPPTVIQAQNAANGNLMQAANDNVAQLSAVVNTDAHTEEHAGELTTHFLTRTDGSNDQELATALANSKVASQVVGATINTAGYGTITVQANQTLTFGADVHVVTADQLILYPGAKIKVNGPIKFDVHSLQVIK